MVSVVTWSAVNRGFKTCSCQTRL